jgi:uncharacterized protein YkwD
MTAALAGVEARRAGIGLALTAALMWLAGCAGLDMALPAAPVAVDAGAAARLVSAYRLESGLKSVALDERLMRAARSQALLMAQRDRMGHRVGGPLPRRVSAEGYEWGAAAENLGRGYDSLEAAFAGWQASAGHRKNLLNPHVTQIGVAAVRAPGSQHGTYWALILAAPRERPGDGPAFVWGG